MAILATFGFLVWLPQPLSAATSGLFTYTDDGTSVTITGYPNNAVGQVVIPSKIAGKPVTVIGGGAFHHIAGLTSVTIPSNVTYIGGGAFTYCTSLATVNGGSGVTTINTNAFSGCSALTSFSIPPKVTFVGNEAFSACTGLTSVTITNKVTYIGENAFAGCDKITSIPFPASVSYIGGGAFSSCRGLTSVTLPPNLTSIAATTFAHCTGLTSVTIPPGVTTIGAQAFYNCTDLTAIDLPSGLTSIGNNAFYNCTGLTSVTLPAGVTSIGTEAFINCSDLTNALFLGNAPTLATNVFGNTAAGFSINYLNGKTGFSSPTWNGYPSAALDWPEIVVEQPFRHGLVDGAATIDFGDVPSGSSGPVFTFRVRNTGTADLTGLAITVTGSKSQFDPTPLSKNKLAAGAKATFTVTFHPSTIGKINANISIISNDHDESPFTIKLTGKGMVTAATIGASDATRLLFHGRVP